MTGTPVSIAILVFPETSASVAYGMFDMFASAGRDWGVITDGAPGPELLRPILVARQKGILEVSNGVQVRVETDFANCPDVDVVCVPEVNLPPATPLAERFDAEIEWLRERHKDGATLAAACSGAMLFAEAGLLEGYDATTHWAWCDTLQQRFPAVNVQSNRALVATGQGQRLLMAGAGTSWLDLSLYIIGRLIGIEAAMQVARIHLIDWHHIGQQPFARLARTRQVEDGDIARCQVWIAENYRHPHPVASMAKVSGLAERTFKRRFRQATGMAPLEYTHALRIEEAKQMLESGDAPVEAVANEVGYEDAGYFSRLFRRNVALTPAQYRRRFGGLRRALSLS